MYCSFILLAFSLVGVFEKIVMLLNENGGVWAWGMSKRLAIPNKSRLQISMAMIFCLKDFFLIQSLEPTRSEADCRFRGIMALFLSFRQDAWSISILFDIDKKGMHDISDKKRLVGCISLSCVLYSKVSSVALMSFEDEVDYRKPDERTSKDVI